MNFYDSCSQATGVDREAAKKVLLWYVEQRESGNDILFPMLRSVERFNREVIDLPIPSEPMPLSKERTEFAEGHLLEEVREFVQACAEGNVHQAVDAMIDLAYVALGRVVEMGVAPRAAFEAVHLANMRKVRGTVSKRPHSLGHDAVKPEGWQSPDRDLDLLLKTTLDDVKQWFELSPVLEEVSRLRNSKGGDYNNVPGGRDAYFPFGDQSYVHIIYTKALRALSLANKQLEGKKPKFESMRDTMLDIINYSTFYVEWMDRSKTQETDLSLVGSDITIKKAS